MTNTQQKGKMNMQLYRVKLKGFHHSATGKIYGTSYVVSNSLDEAYKKVRDFLDKEEIGFPDDRELHEITVIAEENRYGNLQTLLFL